MHCSILGLTLSRSSVASNRVDHSHEWKRKDVKQDKGAVHALTLAGTAQTTNVYDCVVFDVTNYDVS